MQRHVNYSEVYQDLNEIDKTEFAEFVRLCVEHQPGLDFEQVPQADVEAAFLHIDTDGGGTISRAELHSGISKMPGGQTPSREAVDAMLAEFDEEGDGDLDFAEFLVLFVSL